MEEELVDVSPMSAQGAGETTLAKIWEDPDWIAEEKLDGSRYTLHIGKTKNRLFSRCLSAKDGKRIEKTDNVPHLRDLKLSALAGTILDGEVAVRGNSKSSKVTRVMGSLPAQALERQLEDGYIVYKAFDIVRLKGTSLMDMEYQLRWESLKKILDRIEHGGHIELPRRVTEGKKAFCDKIWAEGGEGVILKHKQGKYQPGYRSAHWLKVKAIKTWNVVCTGFTKGNGKYADQIGAIKFGLYVDGKLKETGQTSGMADDVRKDASDNRDAYIGQVFEVEGQEMGSNGAVRHPRFKGWRSEVIPKTCTLDDEKASC